MDTNYRLTHPLAHYGILVVIYGVGLLTLLSHILFHMSHNHNTPTPVHTVQSLSRVTTCTTAPAHTHSLHFTRKGIVPSEITAQRCDELIVVNDTGDEVMAALGAHLHHMHYPGFEEKPLSQGQSYSFRLSEAGTFPLHDHDNEGLRAMITVSD